jgi:hypothetical protein
MAAPASLLTSPGLQFYREVRALWARVLSGGSITESEQRNAGLTHCRSQVCRCVPFVIKQFEIGEMTNKHNVRRAVAERFDRQRQQTNPDVRFTGLRLAAGRRSAACHDVDDVSNPAKLCTQAVEMLILKGRQELEVRPAARLTSRSNTLHESGQQCCH